MPFATPPPSTHVPPPPLADVVSDLLASPAVTVDRLRDAVIRAGRTARRLAVAPDALLASLAARVSRRTPALPAARRAELLARVQWWAIHGYYGAD